MTTSVKDGPTTGMRLDVRLRTRHRFDVAEPSKRRIYQKTSRILSHVPDWTYVDMKCAEASRIQKNVV